jgi:hypothetical protein
MLVVPRGERNQCSAAGVAIHRFGNRRLRLGHEPLDAAVIADESVVAHAM